MRWEWNGTLDARENEGGVKMYPAFPIKYPVEKYPIEKRFVKEKEPLVWQKIMGVALVIMAIVSVLNLVLQAGVSVYVARKAENGDYRMGKIEAQTYANGWISDKFGESAGKEYRRGLR